MVDISLNILVPKCPNHNFKVKVTDLTFYGNVNFHGSILQYFNF